MTQIGQRSLDSPITPTAVFLRHPQDQILDPRRFSRSAASPFTTAIMFLRDQSAMPGQQGLGRDNRRPLSQNPASKSLGPRGQSAALVIVGPESPLAELFAQHSVLFPKVVDQLQLLL